MIPKKIHYCWFGRNPLPKSAKKCIASWRKFFPDYEIIEWNEDNYNIRKNTYISQAYDAKKYAFVSDYARFDILYQYGGVYFDTDVEVIRSFDDILSKGAFMGCEIDGAASLERKEMVADSSAITVAPGLGIAASPEMQVYAEILDCYHQLAKKNDENVMSKGYVVPFATNVLKEHGMTNVKGIQWVEDITIYPVEYFNPLDSATGRLHKTENTHAIHWYTASWMSPGRRLRSKITRPLHRIVGVNFLKRFKKK